MENAIKSGIGKQNADTLAISSQSSTRVQIMDNIYSLIGTRTFYTLEDLRESFFSLRSAQESFQTSLPALLFLPDISCGPDLFLVYAAECN